MWVLVYTHWQTIDCECACLAALVSRYDWFQAQRHLYPTVNFTGTHLVGANTKVGAGSASCGTSVTPHLTQHRPVHRTSQKHTAGGVSLKEFFNANVDQHGMCVTPAPLHIRGYHGLAPHLPHHAKHARRLRRYVAGRPVFSYDDTHLEAFDEVPAGLVKRVVRKGRTPTSQLLREAMAAWDEAERRMVPDLADPVKCVGAPASPRWCCCSCCPTVPCSQRRVERVRVRVPLPRHRHRYDKETWESTTVST